VWAKRKKSGFRAKSAPVARDYQTDAGRCDRWRIAAAWEWELEKSYPVYVVDDDPGVHDWAHIVCAERELNCRTFWSGDEFLDEAGGLMPGCVLLDMRMPRRSGLQVQAEIVKRGLNMPVIAMTGYGDVEVAVQSMKLGAVDFLEKPFPQEVLLEALSQGFKRIEQMLERPARAEPQGR
jgi:two-component system response regulator FixJ